MIDVFSSLVFSTLYFCRISPLGTILSNRKIGTVELTEEIVDTILSCLVRKCLLSERIFFSYQWYYHLLHLFNNILRSGDKLSFSFYAVITEQPLKQASCFFRWQFCSMSEVRVKLNFKGLPLPTIALVLMKRKLSKLSINLRYNSKIFILVSAL